MRRLFVISMIALVGGCSEGGLSNKTDTAASGDGRSSEASVALDSRPADSVPTDHPIDDARADVNADTADTASIDSGSALDVADTPSIDQGTAADAKPLIDAQPAIDGNTAIDGEDGEDGGRLGPLSIEAGTPHLDGPFEADAEPDGATFPPEPADAWACNAPACWTDLMKDCQPSGTCRQQVSGKSSNRCYANGIQVLATVHGVATMTTTVKTSTKTCFELVFDMTGGTSVGSIKDGNGTTVATITDAPSGRSAIACLGHDPVVLNEACDSLPWVAGACESGDCNP